MAPTRVPRKDSRFPGRVARCWYCGCLLVWGGNGMTENLQCNGSRQWRCWNSVGINGELVTEKVVDLITGELFALKGCDKQYVEMVQHAQKNVSGSRDQQLKSLQQREADLDKQKKNIMDTIRQLGPTEIMQQLLTEWQQQRTAIARQKQEILGMGEDLG